MKIFSGGLKISSVYLLIGSTLIVGCLLAVGLLMLSNSGYFVSKGVPMSNEDVANLCTKLEAEDELICASNNKVYPADFSPLISNKFKTASSTYQDVQLILYQFQTNFENNQNAHILVSHYDLNRDGISDLSIFFEGTLEDNNLQNIIFRGEID